MDWCLPPVAAELEQLRVRHCFMTIFAEGLNDPQRPSLVRCRIALPRLLRRSRVQNHVTFKSIINLYMKAVTHAAVAGFA